MNRYIASIQILRPLNIILCFFAVLIGAFIIGGLRSPLLPYTVLTVICFAGASNILNDVLDVHIDSVNRPDRVLPSGSLNIIVSLILMGFLFGIGILASTYLHPLGQQIAIITVLPLLVLYNPLFKGLPLIGNIVVGGILGLVFIFTECGINGNVDMMLIPFLLTTTLSIIRELCKDCADITGDSTVNLKTFPCKYGLINTLWVLRFLAIVLCFLAITPYLSGQYGIIYFISIILGVEIPILYTLFKVLSEKSGMTDYIKVSKILKGITITGMLAIFSSAF